MADRSGGRGSSWSYHQELGSNISSSSGTVVSTANTSNVSTPSTISMESAMRFLSLGIHEDVNCNNVEDWEEAEEESFQRKEATGEEAEGERIRSLVQEFFSAPLVNCSIKRGDMSVVERWLKELGVGWVLHRDDGASAVKGEKLDRDVWSWIRALDQIARTIHLTKSKSLFPDRGSMGLTSICEREYAAERSIVDRSLLTLFIQETMLTMLTFVDALVALDPNGAITSPYHKIDILLLVRDALSEASTNISLPSTQFRGIQGEMNRLFSAKRDKATEAIRGTMEDIWARIMAVEDGDDSECNRQALNGLSDIHDVTRSVAVHIRYLWLNYSSLYPIVFPAASPSLGKYVTKIGDTTDPMDMLIIQMISCLEEKLAKRSQSFTDKGLKYLFLINNLCSILQECHSPYVTTILTHKIEDHIETYLRESWAPVLSCFTQPNCFGKNYSPLSKFESAFQINYDTQKLWKVPDPQTRQKLRKAITKKIISVLHDNNVSTPKFTPEHLKEMLQELFEG